MFMSETIKEYYKPVFHLFIKFFIALFIGFSGTLDLLIASDDGDFD